MDHATSSVTKERWKKGKRKRGGKRKGKWKGKRRERGRKKGKGIGERKKKGGKEGEGKVKERGSRETVRSC